MASGTNLKDDFIERASWWAKHYLAQPRIVRTSMAGTLQISTRAIEIHGTPCVRASAAVRPVFPFTQSQQHSRIVSCGVVEVEAGAGQQ
jgi:hypothetical protein